MLGVITGDDFIRRPETNTDQVPTLRPTSKTKPQAWMLEGVHFAAWSQDTPIHSLPKPALSPGETKAASGGTQNIKESEVRDGGARPQLPSPSPQTWLEVPTV